VFLFIISCKFLFTFNNEAERADGEWARERSLQFNRSIRIDSLGTNVMVYFHLVVYDQVVFALIQVENQLIYS
jgi:hypothetical protein